MADPNADPELGGETADVAALTAERERLAIENAELQNQLLRRAAEFENFRKRTDRDRLELAEYASMEAVKALLPILDDFERALKVETADKDFARGVEMIYQRVFDQLKKLGLEAVPSDSKFDPNLHHAIEMVETTDAEDQTILAEYQRGFKLRGRLVRPAMVKVAVNG